MQRELKQRYLLANSPNPPSFDQERSAQFEKLIVLISTTERSKWLSTGFTCGPLIESYKQVYGLTSEQFQTLLMLLINIAFQEVGLSTDVRAYILRLLNTMSQFQIKITDNFKISNQKLLKYLEELAKEGLEGALKHSDAVIQDLSKFILYFSRFGEEVIDEALEMAIESSDIRYLVIFLRSIKSEASAVRILTELFSDNNLWDRDCSWFYILGEVIKKFPKIDYSAYYQTIMQEVIRAFTTIINADNEQSIKKLTVSDSYLQIQPVLKSAALIIAFLILPSTNPQHIFIKSCIQRLFALIQSSLDYVSPPDYLGDLMTFAKAFVRYFLMRYRGERGLFKLFNEDVIDDIHELNDKNILIDSEAQSFFDSLWGEIIPKIIFLEDPEECKPSKIIAELCMYKPQIFLELALGSVMKVVNREDPTLVSFHGAKITILFLQQFVILDQPEFLPIFFESTLKMMGHLDRLGMTENLDIVELFCRNFIYLSEEQLNEYYIQSAINDTLTMLLDNLEPMSIALEDSEEEQSQLYVDFNNIYFPFFLRLDENQISTFSEKFIYKLINTVPEHKGAYQMIIIVLTYIDSSFPSKVFPHLRAKLLCLQAESLKQIKKVEGEAEAEGKSEDKAKDEVKSEKKGEGSLQKQEEGEGQGQGKAQVQKQGEGQEKGEIQIQGEGEVQGKGEIQIQIEGDGDQEENTWEFLKSTEETLHTSNEQALKWYTSIIQSLFQYHPQNVVKYWNQIQPLIVVLIHDWDNQFYLELALDILYNIILCLCKPHLDWKQFRKPENANYRTLHLQFDKITPKAKEVIDYIFQTYFVDIKLYLQDFYNKEIESSYTDLTVLGDFQNFHEIPQDCDIIRIRKRNLKLANYVLMPDVDKEEEAYDKRIIYRALSVQYTVLSALMFRVPFHSNLENIGDFLIDPQYYNLRADTCKYLEWILQLLGRFSLMGDQQCVKLFNFFWRESHDQVSWTGSLQATNQKLSPYYYPQLHKKKEILRSPFLVINEAYVSHMARMEFHLMVDPTAYFNNKQYLQSNFILGLSPIYEPSLHSYFPNYVQVHQYHRQLIAIGRYHLNPKNEEGYLSKYLKEEDPATKERYATAIRFLLLSFKRLLNVFSDSCCMRDEFVRNTIFETITLYKLLPKKTEKSLVYELLYVLLVFAFDPNCCEDYKQYSIREFWEFKLNDNSQIKDMEIASTLKSGDINSILKKIQEEEDLSLSYYDLNRELKLTRSCSFENDCEMQKQLQRAVTFLLTKIQQNLDSLEKDFNVYLLMLLLYSNCLHISDPLISKIILLLSKLCQSTYNQVFQMSKTGFFHLVNRFNYHLRTTIQMKNTPIRRPWEQFLKYKYIGAKNDDYQSLKIEKNEQNFYPTKKLIIYKYRKLGQDPNSPTYANQQTLLSIFEDEEKMLNFLKNCSLDPDLKQQDQSTLSLIVSQENFKSVSSGAHKLMHFIWDSNPTKTPLFMGILERYAASPLNFYNRLFRKIFRMGSDKVRDSCLDLTAKLRQSEEPEMIRLSFYISCELLVKNPGSSDHKPFLDYLGECTKENFDYVLMGFYGIFTSNFVNAEKCYNVVLEKLRALKGAPRLRHLELSNTYMIAQGRFARKAAIEISSHIMKGIQEGGDEISQAVVSMITECFVQAVNLKSLEDWVQQPLEMLLKNEKIYLLNEHVGYNRENFLMALLTELIKKAREEDDSVESQKLRINSQVVRKILASITIFRFNDYFYRLLRQIIIYVMERPQSPVDDDSADAYVITQLCDSEYPEEIYKDLLQQLLPMTDRTPYVVRKKLMFLQGMAINRSFRLNRIDLPPLLSLNQKQLTLDHIITVATILRLMKNAELTELVQEILHKQKRQKHETYTLIAVLMATGSRDFDWKETILRDLVRHKKEKLVKEGISQWWKGKSPQTQQEYRMQTLVRNFENPYSYFA